MDAHPVCRRARDGFTLVELLVATTIMILVVVLLSSMTLSTGAIWRDTAAKAEQFRGADAAFEGITRRLSQATLNTYWDYDDPANPKKYLRQSELRFISGTMSGPTSGTAKPLITNKTPRRPTHGVFFQVPLGMVDDRINFSGLGNLLNTWGYYIEFNTDLRPAFMSNLRNPPPPKYRYRLMEFIQPSDALSVYSRTAGKPDYLGREWFSEPLAKNPPPSHPLGENVIALVILPRLSKKDELATTGKLAPRYAYDSTATMNPGNESSTNPSLSPKNQLPPILQVTLVVLSEKSAGRLENGATPPLLDAALDPLFQEAAKFDADLAILEAELIKQKVDYRVFTSSVSIRGAKWSRN